MNAARTLPRMFMIAVLIVAASFIYSQNASSQRFLGNARQKCSGSISVVTQDSDLLVRQFEARSVEIKAPAIEWKCEDTPQAAIECPANTNKILIDRSQGGNSFSVICLHQ